MKYILLTLAEDTDFPYTDQPKPVNNMSIFDQGISNMVLQTVSMRTTYM